MGLCSSSNQPVNPNAPSGGAEKTRNASNGNALPRKSISDVDVSTLHGSALMSHRYKVARSQKHFKRPGSGNLEAAQSATSPGGDEKSWSLLTPKQRKLVTKMVQKNPVFTNVSEAMLEGLMGEIVSVSVEEGETVYQDGDDADLFYIVASGALVAMRGDQRKEYTEGQTVGEDALRLKSKRSGTCTVAQSGVLLALSRVVYQRLVVKFGAKELNRGVSRLRSVPILAPLTDQQLAMVADALTEVRFERNHQIIKQHDKGDAFYIIKHGEVVCRYENSTEKGRTVKAGDFFGEGALLSDSKRTMNVFAASRSVTCLRMSREDFLSILGGLHELLDHNFNKRVLSSVPLFKHLTDSEQDEVAEHMETRKYPEGEYIIRQGDQAAAFYIVRHGHVKVTRRNETGAITEVGVMVEGDFFGEGSFLTGDPTTANCIAATPDVICTALKREAFTEILGSIEDVLAQNFSERVKLWEPGEGIEWKDLVPISRLGQGNFGRVDIVRHKVSGKTFALKQLLRKKVELMQLEQYTENERAILADLQCPFVVRLHATYRTRHSVYFLMDFIVGGELSRVLEEMPSLPPDVARFYAANLVLALKYLHGKYICHRDIKPENIMVEKNGYLKLVDFGLAKRLKTGGRTFTICGTPDYVAAEVLRIGTSTGYGLAADWWALGILLFRFATGYHPFGLTSSSDLSEVWSILCEYANRYPHFEFGLPSEPLGDVVKRLLHPNPVKRLGGQKSGARKLMKHPFFSAIDWSSLARQTLSPPFAPDVKDMLDTTNFVDEEGEKNRDHLSVIAKDDPGDAWYANF